MRRIIKYGIRFGILLFTAGFLYDIMFAGIPPQDPPLELTVSYERNKSIANWIMMSGIIVVALAGLILLVDVLVQYITKEKAIN